MKRYHGVSPLEQKRSMPAWLAKPSFVIGLLIVLVVILMALFPQFIAPYDPIATDVTVSNQAPSAAHWFGTDFYGRDIFSRVIWGTRIDQSLAQDGHDGDDQDGEGEGHHDIGDAHEQAVQEAAVVAGQQSDHCLLYTSRCV